VQGRCRWQVAVLIFFLSSVNVLDIEVCFFFLLAVIATSTTVELVVIPC
jgi:hypothetical protein